MVYVANVIFLFQSTDFDAVADTAQTTLSGIVVFEPSFQTLINNRITDTAAIFDIDRTAQLTSIQTTLQTLKGLSIANLLDGAAGAMPTSHPDYAVRKA